MEVKPGEYGGLTIYQRGFWVEKIFAQVKSVIAAYGDAKVSTCSSLCVTTLKNSYVRGQAFPFINIPIRYGDKELLGLYEYFGEQMPLSDEYIYCDIVIHSLYYSESNDSASKKMQEEKALTLLKAKHSYILNFEDGMATIIISRKLLEEEKFTAVLRNLLDEAVKIQSEIM